MFSYIVFYHYTDKSLLHLGIKVKESKVAQLCLTLCDPMDCNLPGSSVHGILQAGMLEWVVMSFSRGSSQPRDQTWVSSTAGRFFTYWATRDSKVTCCVESPQIWLVLTYDLKEQRCQLKFWMFSVDQRWWWFPVSWLRRRSIFSPQVILLS